MARAQKKPVPQLAEHFTAQARPQGRVRLLKAGRGALEPGRAHPGFLDTLSITFANHQTERDSRMVKVQQTISGTVRREDGRPLCPPCASGASSADRVHRGLWRCPFSHCMGARDL